MSASALKPKMMSWGEPDLYCSSGARVDWVTRTGDKTMAYALDPSLVWKAAAYSTRAHYANPNLRLKTMHGLDA